MQGRITFDRSDGVRRVGRTVVLSYQPCDERGRIANETRFIVQTIFERIMLNRCPHSYRKLHYQYHQGRHHKKD